MMHIILKTSKQHIFLEQPPENTTWVNFYNDAGLDWEGCWTTPELLSFLEAHREWFIEADIILTEITQDQDFVYFKADSLLQDSNFDESKNMLSPYIDLQRLSV